MLPTLGHWGSAGHDGHGDGVREASHLIHRGVRGAALHWRFSALSNKQELPEISTLPTDRYGALRHCRTGNRIVSELAGTSDGQSLKLSFHLGDFLPAAAGVKLARIVWVRCRGNVQRALRTADHPAVSVSSHWICAK